MATVNINQRFMTSRSHEKGLSTTSLTIVLLAEKCYNTLQLVAHGDTGVFSVPGVQHCLADGVARWTHGAGGRGPLQDRPPVLVCNANFMMRNGVVNMQTSDPTCHLRGLHLGHPAVVIPVQRRARPPTAGSGR